ncbi:MAG: hypothetical protein AAFP24_02200, partial [Pseudomonadota bacterium]
MSEADIMMPMRTGEIRIHDEAGFEGMRKAGRLVAECLDMLVGEVKPGETKVFKIGSQTTTILKNESIIPA